MTALYPVAQLDWTAGDDDEASLAAYLNWSHSSADIPPLVEFHPSSGEFARWVTEDELKDARLPAVQQSRNSDVGSICGWDLSSHDPVPCTGHGPQLSHIAPSTPDTIQTALRPSSTCSSGWFMQQAGVTSNACSSQATQPITIPDSPLYEEPLRFDASFSSQHTAHAKTSPFQQMKPTTVLCSPQAAMSTPTSNYTTSNSVVAMPSSEDDWRRHVQMQVVKLLESECDQAQVAWLQELYSMTTSAPAALLHTLSRQLDVLLMPLPEAPNISTAAATACPPATTGASSPFTGGPWSSLPVRHYTSLACGKAGAGADAAPNTHHLVSGQMSHLTSTPKVAPYGSRSSGNVIGVHQELCTPHVDLLQSNSISGCHPSLCPASFQEHCSGNGPMGQVMPGLKRGSAASISPTSSDVCDVSRSTHVKAEPSVSMTATGATSGEHRWWRKQNNFTIAIDEIVRKVQSDACLGMVPAVAPPLPSLLLDIPDMDPDHDGASISTDRVRQVYDKPIKEAAKELGVSVMSLKRTCRKMGVRRWPFRKLASLSELEATVNEDQLEQQLQPRDKEAVIQYIEAEKARIMVEPDREVDPMLHNLRKAKIHMKYEKWGRKTLGRGKAAGASKMVLSSLSSLDKEADAMMYDDDAMDGF